MQNLGSYTYVLECCLYWQRPSYCRFHQNFTRWRILSAKGEMLHWSTNSYSSLSPHQSPPCRAHCVGHTTWYTLILPSRAMQRYSVNRKYIRVRIADQTNNACTYLQNVLCSIGPKGRVSENVVDPLVGYSARQQHTVIQDSRSGLLIQKWSSYTQKSSVSSRLQLSS